MKLIQLQHRTSIFHFASSIYFCLCNFKRCFLCKWNWLVGCLVNFMFLMLHHLYYNSTSHNLISLICRCSNSPWSLLASVWLLSSLARNWRWTLSVYLKYVTKSPRMVTLSPCTTPESWPMEPHSIQREYTYLLFYWVASRRSGRDVAHAGMLRSERKEALICETWLRLHERMSTGIQLEQMIDCWE